MSGGSLYLKFESLIKTLTEADDGSDDDFDIDAEAMQDIYDLQDAYNKKTPEERYTAMVLAESVLFGGGQPEIRAAYDHRLREEPQTDKAAFVANDMRNRLVHDMADDDMVSRICNIIRHDDANIERTWECLFAAAAYCKAVQPAELDKYATNIHERTQHAVATKTPGLYEALQSEVAIYLGDTSPAAQYHFHKKLISLASGHTPEDIDAALAHHCGSVQVEDKLAYINSVRENAHAAHKADTVPAPTHVPPPPKRLN